MGLKDVRARVIEKLALGRIQHEINRSGSIDEKNLLLTGRVSVADVIELLNSTRGDEFSTSKHHLVREIDVHVFKPTRDGITWYIKCYLIDPDVWFISVHQ